jgi:hypothetical protein
MKTTLTMPNFVDPTAIATFLHNIVQANMSLTTPPTLATALSLLTSTTTTALGLLGLLTLTCQEVEQKRD